MSGWTLGGRALRTARAAEFTCALGLVYGTVVHAMHLAMGGTAPYPSMPRWLAAYFVLLAVLVQRPHRISAPVHAGRPTS
jgi:hypothetical protein